MDYLRLIWRFLKFAWLTLEVVLQIFIEKTILGADLPRALALRRRWANRLMHHAGVRITVKGAAPTAACLLVCNHRSYLDPIVIIRDCDAFPVSKSELASWPVLGWGARMAGVLFLRRADAGHRNRMLHAIGRTIAKGYPVLLFPEGTTSDLPGMLPFRKGAFVLAARSGFPVMPVALVFSDPADFWVGKDTFLQHAVRRFRCKEIVLTVVYGPVFESTDADSLLNSAAGWIETQLRQTNFELI